MVRYIGAAMALKAFSSSPRMRALYRKVGNHIGSRRRGTGQMPGYYAERVKRVLHLQRAHGLVQNGDRIIELGTGWLHWEALTLRLFYDIEAVLFDVWDNRQLSGLKNYLMQLAPMLNDGFGLTASERKRAHSLVESIMNVESFQELYTLLGFEYVVEPSGSLSQFESGSFQLVVSGGVLEHVKREALPRLIADTRRILSPGGWAVHSIDTSDHLSHYDGRMSKKMYLGLSERAWRYLCANDVQYINRVQRGEWISLLSGCGFELVEEETRRVDIARIKLAERYAQMDKRDLECTVLRFALRNGTGINAAISEGRQPAGCRRE